MTIGKVFLVALLALEIVITDENSDDLEVTIEEEDDEEIDVPEDIDTQYEIPRRKPLSPGSGSLMPAFLELHEDDPDLACSACNLAVKKIVGNAKAILRKNPVREALSNLAEGCEFEGMANLGGEYKNFQKMMRRGGGISGGLSMKPEMDENIGKSCVSVVEKYEDFIWETFLSKKKKMSGWSGYRLSKEICHEKEEICPEKPNRRRPVKTEL